MGDPFDFDDDGQVSEEEEEEAFLLFMDDDDEENDDRSHRGGRQRQPRGRLPVDGSSDRGRNCCNRCSPAPDLRK